jgi:ABC-type nitrate/sulfonate/bicarbonate transport system substrate-binding protein/outer membrane protein OmpA-like peptidoglycan-associated protein
MKALRHALLAMTILLLPVGATALNPPSAVAASLAEVTDTSVAACGNAAVTQVPLITWGGDIATVYANGNARKTAEGSIFSAEGLTLKLVREDVFSKQLEAYLKCRSPYLRGTMGMVNMAAEVANRDERTKLQVVYQMTWSAGGDALVVKEGIRKPSDLKGKTIAIQSFGPHVDYLTKVLADANLTMSEVKIKWMKDLTGTKKTPMSAFYGAGVDAAMVIIPDGLALTSGGVVGTGSEDSVKGARILLSTKTANRIIADVYAVRADYLKSHRREVEKFVHGLMRAEEELEKLFKNPQSRANQYKKMIAAAADVLLDSPQAVGDTEGLYADCEFVGWKGNVKFFSDKDYPRNFKRLTAEIQRSFIALGLLGGKVAIAQPQWDYERLKEGITDVAGVVTPRFDTKKVAKVVTRKQQQGTLDEGVLFSFEVFFKPNQNSFPAEMYDDSFKKVTELASTYGGAIITVEGHSDPLNYLKKKKGGAAPLVLKQIKQSAKNLSLTRANAVRDSVVAYAGGKRITVDPTQFAVIGHGIMKPRSGMCGSDPCAPKSKKEWHDNMRVEFKLIQIEAEQSTFELLD